MTSGNPGTGHLLGRDIVYQDLKTGSLLVGEELEVKELDIGLDDQVLTVSAGDLIWKAPETPTPATGQNLGAGERVLSNVVDSHFQFRTLLAGDGMVMSESTNEILFDVDLDALAGLMGSGVLGDPTTGTLQDPAYPGATGPAVKTWTDMTPVTDAIVDLNKIVGLMLPEQPPLITDITLSMAGGGNTREGDQILLANGVVNNSGTAPILPGEQVFRTTIATAESAVTTEFGPGTNGDVGALVNGVADGSITLARGDDSGTDGSLTITADYDYPVLDPGFWEAITAKVVSLVPAGLNRFQLSHSVGGVSNEAMFLYDNLNITPTVSGLTAVADGGNDPSNYSSGIPHLAGGSAVNVSATVNNLSSNAFLSASVIQVGGTSGIGSTVGVDPGTFSIPSIMNVSEAPQSVANVPFIIGANVFTTGQLRVRGRNAGVNGSWLNDTFNINAMSNIPSNKIDELNVDVSAGTVPGGAKATAERTALGDGDNPDPSAAFALLDAGWDSSMITTPHAASVTGGVLKNDLTDYTTGYIPSGPNYSTHNPAQYVTWFFRRGTVSNFTISVTGSYSGMWVTMDVPFGIAPNNWIDMGTLYAGAGTPGANGSNGCAVGTVAGGGSGTFTCTFGPETSSAATNNVILVRFRLDAGQTITDLSF